MQTDKEIPTIAVVGDDIVIRLNVDDLVFVTENRTDGQYKVLDKMQFLRDVANQFDRYYRINDECKGNTALQSLIDACVDQVVELAYESIEYK